ncbi:MAG: UDP-N-acetylmuramate--L-alanine ligase [Chitinophagaceae bacterium]|nr:UDP-N-acetylmuramate--L-alanine ligase [Chitinophagaceae bacterium]
MKKNTALIPTQPDLVVYTPAIPKDHKEWLYYQEAGQKIVKRSDVLQMISNSSFNICIAGTHGKTTISTMTAHLLRHSGFGCNAFLGGISGNYNTNFWSHQRNVCVIEADEYDRSFLKLSPDIAIISAMDADHLDIYGTAENVEQAFIDFAGKVREDGKLIVKHGLKRSADLQSEKYISYSREDHSADVFTDNLKLDDGSYIFDICLQGHWIRNLRLNMGGLHNVENITAAITAAWLVGIEDEKIKAAVDAFRGVKRRFESVYKSDQRVLIDDYAHHPEELRALLTSAKGLFAGRKMLLIFQPHLYSRTRDFADGFAEVLGIADEVVLLPIYPARELPVEGVNSEMLIERMREMKKTVLQKTEVLDYIDRWIDENEKDINYNGWCRRYRQIAGIS